MKEITTKLFLITELIEEAREKALNELRSDLDYPSSDNVNTLEKFSELFKINIYNWNYDTYTYDFTFNVENEDIEELEGKRLYSYIHNNFDEIIKKDCPFTGYYLDETILKNIRLYLQRPNLKYNYKDLIEECLNDFFKACSNDMEYYYSNEHLEEMSNINEWYYFKNGKDANHLI